MNFDQNLYQIKLKMFGIFFDLVKIVVLFVGFVLLNLPFEHNLLDLQNLSTIFNFKFTFDFFNLSQKSSAKNIFAKEFSKPFD
jgi:hypothetical protein